MARADQLLASYRRHVSLTPSAHLPLSQRVWFIPCLSGCLPRHPVLK